MRSRLKYPIDSIKIQGNKEYYNESQIIHKFKSGDDIMVMMKDLKYNPRSNRYKLNTISNLCKKFDIEESLLTQKQKEELDYCLDLYDNYRWVMPSPKILILNDNISKSCRCDISLQELTRLYYESI